MPQADTYRILGIRRAGKSRLFVDLAGGRCITATGSPAVINRAVQRLLDAMGDDLSLEQLAAALAGLTIVE